MSLLRQCGCGLVFGLWVGACGGTAPKGPGNPPLDSGTPVDDTAADPGLMLSGVTWGIDFDEAGLTPLADGGFSATREDGVEFEVHDGWLVVYVLVLEPCGTLPSGRVAVPPPHGLPDHASTMARAQALSLRTLDAADGGAQTFDQGRFCDVGIALLRGDTVTENAPLEPDLNGVSLVLSGRLRRSAEAPWEALTLTSGLPTEADLALPETTPADPVGVQVSLRPAHMLDNIDLDDHPDRVALAVLDNLAMTAGVTLYSP